MENDVFQPEIEDDTTDTPAPHAVPTNPQTQLALAGVNANTRSQAHRDHP